MTVLFIGYWNLRDPLTRSTIIPHLEILSAMPIVDRIDFFQIEREEVGELPEFTGSEKVRYHPFLTKERVGYWLEKASELVQVPRVLADLIDEGGADVMIARGAMAGTLAYLASKKTGISFFVESFEPHSEYMFEAGVWGRYDLRYWVQKYFERRQIRYSAGLMPVSEKYAKYLVQRGVNSEKIVTVPCAVDTSLFKFSSEKRSAIRKELDIPPDAIVGVYVGRFGGLYLNDEAFRLYRRAFEYFGSSFWLVLLTPGQFLPLASHKVAANGLPAARVRMASVEHEEVPGFLSASDFAFATYKPGPNTAYLSPVKVGEYWANGLPVILTNGVGDDSDLIKEDSALGTLLDVSDIESQAPAVFSSIERSMAAISRTHGAGPRLVTSRRSFVTVAGAYRHFLRLEDVL